MSMIVSPIADQKAPSGSAMEARLLALYAGAVAMRDQKFQQRQVERAERAYHGLIYSDVDRADGRSWVQNPFLWEIIARFLPILMAQKPTFATRAAEENDTLLNDQANFALDYLWRRQRMEKTSALWAKRAMKTGTSFLHTGVEYTSRGPKLFTNMVHHTRVLPDPAASDDADWTYCFVEASLTLEELEALYGDAALRLIYDDGLTPTAAIRMDTVAGQAFGQHATPIFANAGSATNIGSRPQLEQLIASPQNRQHETKRYKVLEFYYYDRSEVEVDDVLDDGEEVRVRVEQYGRPRHITLIEDHYSEELDRETHCIHGQIPVIRLSCDDDDGEFWGGGLIAPLVDTVEQISDVQNIITNAARLCSQPWWKVSTDSGIEVDSIYGDAGMVLPVNPGSVVELVGAPQLPSFLFEFWNRMLSQANNASGVSEAARGNIGGLGEDTSGKAIQLAQDPFYTRMRMFQLNLGTSLARWAYQTFCNAAQYHDDEWWSRLLPQKLLGQGLAWAGWDEDDFQNMFDIVMTDGSNLPPDKTQKYAQALSLFNAGAFDPAKPEAARFELLKAADWPDYARVVQKVTASAPPMLPGMMPGQPPPPPAPNKALGEGLSPEAEIGVRANPEGEE